MKSIQAYMDEFKLDQTLSEVLNECVKSRAENPYGTMSASLLRKSPSIILGITAGYLFDNRGKPATYVDVRTHRGVFRSTCPNASNAGIYERSELRDDDPTHFHGNGVMRAVYEIQEKIAPILIGKDPRNQTELDEIICRITKFSNVIYPLSVAICKAGACESNMSVSEYLSTTTGTTTGKESLYYVLTCLRFGHTEIHLVCKDLYKLADITFENHEPFVTPEEALCAVTQAIDDAGHSGAVSIGINMNASEFITEDNQYAYNTTNTENSTKMSRDQMIEMYLQWIHEFPLMFIEDPFDQDDYTAFQALKDATEETSCFVLGTNLYASREKRVRQPWTHALTLKPSAAGSVTEIKRCVQRAREHELAIMVSGRAGDVTNETFEWELARGVSAEYVRFSRLEKFNN
jgi:enolase